MQLSEALRQAIQPLGLPTVPGQVSHGITKFLKHTGNRVSARSTMLGSWQRATKRIRQGKPVILGVLKVLGAPMAIIGSLHMHIINPLLENAFTKFMTTGATRIN